MYPVAVQVLRLSLNKEAEHAALLARAASLKKKQSIEQEMAKLKAEQEQLELDTEIAASFAKLKVFKDNDLLFDNKSECSSKHADTRCKKELKNSFLVEQHSKRDTTTFSENTQYKIWKRTC